MRNALAIVILLAIGLVLAPEFVSAGQPVAVPTAFLNKAAAKGTTSGFAANDRAQLLQRLARFAEASCPLEQRLFADAADGRLDEFSPLHAALVAGGIERLDRLDYYASKAAGLAAELRAAGRIDGAPRERVEFVFEFMHRRILYGGYDLAATDLRQVLDEGRFNCVSATVLFNFLASELGVDCRGLEMPGHAMSRVVASDGVVDVETTCPRWFSLMHDPKQQAALAAQTAGTAATADRSKAREVTPVQIIAMIYYNRGVDLLADKRFAEAAAANAKSLRLDPTNQTARGNLLATLNNWSIELGNEGQFAGAVDLLRQGLVIDSRFEPFAQNYVHVHRQWADALCRKGRFDEALGILSRATAELPERDYLRQMQADVRTRRATAARAIAN